MCTKAYFWNVRGLNNHDKHLPFQNWLAVHQPLFGAILESHIKELNLNQVMLKVCKDWNYDSNHSLDDDGRIIFIWKAPASCRFMHRSAQSMTCEVSLSSSMSMIFTAVYAQNTPAERCDLWVDLLNTHQALSLDSRPWIIGGDFNQNFSPSDHSSADVNTMDVNMS